VDFERHRIVDVPGLLGRDRTPWGSLRPGPPGGSVPGDDEHVPEATRPWGKPPACVHPDVRAWLGPRRVGRRELKP
jgi:hypothetical protein